MKFLRFANLLFLCFLSWTCESDTVDLTSSFSKIYDNSEFDQLNAVSIRQTADGGYIVLGTLGNSGLVSSVYYDAPFLMRLDSKGRVIWTTRTNTTLRNYIHPVPQLIVNGNDYVFWCMERNMSGQYNLALVKISDANRDPVTVFSVPNGARTWYALLTESKELVLVGVKIQNSETGAKPYTELIKLDANYKQLWAKSFSQGENLNDPRQKELIPDYFFCTEGSYNNQKVYIFNTLSEKGDRVEFKMINVKTGEVVSRKSVNEVFPIAFSQLNDSLFIGAFTNLRDIDLNSSYNWNINQEDYPLNTIFHELALGSRIILQTEQIKNKDVRIFGATTKNYAILLYMWGGTTNGFQVVGRLYLGSSNVYKIADLVRTQDGGLMVLGTTIVSDRFSRICLFKLSKTQIENLVPD